MDETANNHWAIVEKLSERSFFFIRLYPLLQPPSSGEAWFRNALDTKAGYCEQAAAQNAIAGESRQRRFCHQGHVEGVELRSTSRW